VRGDQTIAALRRKVNFSDQDQTICERLDRLCQVSGGHVRNLMGLLNEWILAETNPPLSRDALEDRIRDRRHGQLLSITDQDWQLLRELQERRDLQDRTTVRPPSPDPAYQGLMRKMLIYEYQDRHGQG
jgi:hypothetical protein